MMWVCVCLRLKHVWHLVIKINCWPTDRSVIMEHCVPHHKDDTSVLNCLCATGYATCFARLTAQSARAGYMIKVYHVQDPQREKDTMLPSAGEGGRVTKTEMSRHASKLSQYTHRVNFNIQMHTCLTSSNSCFFVKNTSLIVNDFRNSL